MHAPTSERSLVPLAGALIHCRWCGAPLRWALRDSAGQAWCRCGARLASAPGEEAPR